MIGAVIALWVYAVVVWTATAISLYNTWKERKRKKEQERAARDRARDRRWY